MDNLKKLLHTTSKYEETLKKNGIKNLKDLFEYFPRTYEDRSTIHTLRNLVFDEKGMTATKGYITQKKILARGGKKIYEYSFIDEENNKGSITIFNNGYLASQIKEEQRYIIVGKPKQNYGRTNFTHPEIVPTTGTNKGEANINENENETNNNTKQTNNTEQEEYMTGRIFPIYPELQGIQAGRFAKKIRQNLDNIDAIFNEYLPSEFIKKFNLLSVQETIHQIHYPDSSELNKRAIQRVFFDRLLRIQLHSLINKKNYEENSKNKKQEKSQEPDREIIKNLIELLPFALTNAQKKVLKIVIENLHEDKPMIRLLQGDVGSGKTIVGTIAAYYHHKKHNKQSVFLAPLEVLATQHYKTLSKFLLPLGIRTELLTGSLSASQKEKIKQDLKSGKIHVLIGTHAVLQDNVDFHNLGFVVIDEQHKFGVKQRSFFKQFNSPHILQMSATPIPRSLALAFFGEFEVSIIDEMPAGRLPIKTKIIAENEYLKIKPRILEKINKGEKVFVITPLIEESEKMETLKSATKEFEEITLLFPELRNKIGLLHGKMKPQEKEKIMNKFKIGSVCLLVSTTVIEVGIDIPEATIMIIKNAERFGLSQLHQLRGRIGRSDLQSYCFLETKKKSGDAYNRLKAMEETNDGFKLAEIDLQNRGAGEILGTLQSGESDIPLEVLGDIKFIQKVQEGAKRLLEKHPNLEDLPLLKKYVNEKVGNFLA